METEDDKHLVAEFAIEALEDQGGESYFSVHLLIWIIVLWDMYRPITRLFN